MSDIERRVREIMADLFGISPEEIDAQASPDTIKKWDSLNHLNLTLALEEEFGVTFTEDETMEMLTFELVAMTLAEKLAG